jgi:hypothetical protein
LVTDLRSAVRNAIGFTMKEEWIATAEAAGLSSVDVDLTGRWVLAGWDGEAWFGIRGRRINRLGHFDGPVQVRWAGARLVMMGNRGTRQIVVLLDPESAAVLTEFDMAWVAHEFLANQRWLVTLHGDQSGVPVETNHGTWDDRMAVWDLEGALHTSYPARAGRDGEDVLDVSAACWLDLNTVAFMPCCSFPLLRFSIATFNVQSHTTSPLLHGAAALTMDGTYAIVLIDDDVWVWDTEAIQATRVGPTKGNHVRPGPPGVFLSIRGSEAWATRVVHEGSRSGR